MACPILTFYLTLNSNHWTLDVITFQDPFFKIFANQHCLHHLIPPPRDTSVTTRLRLTTSLPRPNLRTKKYCSFMHFGLHHYKPLETNIVTPNPLYTSLPAPMYIYAHYLFHILFLSITSTTYHLLSGSRAARLLLNWLIDWIRNHWRTQQLFKHYL